MSTGGAASGGLATGGVSTGGLATGGVATGGVATGGVATGGTPTGGMSTGGLATGGMGTGGSSCPTPSPCSVVGATSCAADAPSASSTALLTCQKDTQGCFYLTKTNCGPLPGVCERSFSVAPLISAACADSSQTAWRLPDIAPSNYKDNGDGTVTDNITGLMWQKASTATDTEENAISTCLAASTGGHHDWRLPRRVELATLIDYLQTTPPLINKVFFPDTASSDYATSSTIGSQPYIISFASGYILVDGFVPKFLRCVR